MVSVSGQFKFVPFHIDEGTKILFNDQPVLLTDNGDSKCLKCCFLAKL
jgi:hypothetical protein